MLLQMSQWHLKYMYIATVEDDTEVPAPRRTRSIRSQSARLNLEATFEGFVPANNPNAWRDRDLEYRHCRSTKVLVLTSSSLTQSHRPTHVDLDLDLDLYKCDFCPRYMYIDIRSY